MRLALSEIEIDPTIQIRRSNYEDTIQRYEEAFERLPPVDVFDTAEGLLLADGFHRIAAAERLGHSEIDATVRKGTRQDAAEHAVIANTKNGEPLTAESAPKVCEIVIYLVNPALINGGVPPRHQFVPAPEVLTTDGNRGRHATEFDHRRSGAPSRFTRR